MPAISRRHLLRNAAVGSAILLAGCATTRVGTTTTVTLNVAKVTAYATAGLNAAATVETALAPFPALAAYVTPIRTATALLQSAVAAFSSAVGAQIVVSYDDASVKSQVDSVLAAIEQISGLIGNVVTALVKAGLSVSDGTVNKVQLVQDALVTIVSVFRAVLTTTVPQLAMSEPRALAVLSA